MNNRTKYLKKYKTVDEYISSFPQDKKNLLSEIRKAIKEAEPDAEEVISYNMPAIRMNQIIVWYAAFKNHIGLYPKASGIAAFKKELSVYKGAKGSVQFPLNKPLPVELISRIVKYRVKEVLEGAKTK